jgi:DNA-binding transcriptional regulator YbjK
VARTDTRQRLLDAAIPLVANGGLRALSHRAVETAAGVARGSARYHLGSRHQIVEGLMERLAALDVAAMQAHLHRLAIDHLATGSMDLQAPVRSIITALMGDPDRVLARYWLMLEATRDDTLQPIVRRWRDAFVTIPEPLLARLGADDPAGMSRDLVALLDGVIFEHLSTGRVADLQERASATVSSFIRRQTGQFGL